MRIALNMIFVGGGVAGGRVYCEGLLGGLAARPDDAAYTVFARRGVAVPDLPPRFEVVRAPVTGASSVRRTLYEYGPFPWQVRRGGFDVLHGLGSLSPAAPPARFVLTVHDLIYRHSPASVPLAHRLFMRLVGPRAARRADRVIVPSRFTADDVMRTYRVPASRIRLIPYGPGHGLRRVDDPAAVAAALARYGVRRPYVMSVARGYPHKNLGGLLRACAKLPAGLDPQLVLVGERYMVGPELERLIGELRLADRVVFTGFVPQADLNALYSAASVFAFPSLAEGLGLPILEAMACGAPVVASDAMAVPEAVGDAGVVADARDPGAYAAALAGVLGDEKAQADLRARGLKRAAGFSWERCAADTLAVYREVA